MRGCRGAGALGEQMDETVEGGADDFATWKIGVAVDEEDAGGDSLGTQVFDGIGLGIGEGIDAEIEEDAHPLLVFRGGPPLGFGLDAEGGLTGDAGGLGFLGLGGAGDGFLGEFVGLGLGLQKVGEQGGCAALHGGVFAGENDVGQGLDGIADDDLLIEVIFVELKGGLIAGRDGFILGEEWAKTGHEKPESRTGQESG